MTEEIQNDLAGCVEAIETGYEYMLAYAAQGRVQEQAGGSGPGVRVYLENMADAIDRLPGVLRDALASGTGDMQDAGTTFVDMLQADAEKALAALRLVLNAPAITSRLVDNLNASMQVRTLLTDLFLVDEALKQNQ